MENGKLGIIENIKHYYIFDLFSFSRYFSEFYRNEQFVKWGPRNFIGLFVCLRWCIHVCLFVCERIIRNLSDYYVYNYKGIQLKKKVL